VGGAFQVAHGLATDPGGAHLDIGGFRAFVESTGQPAGPGGVVGSIEVLGMHWTSRLSVKPSFTNVDNVPITVRVTPDYRSNGQIIPGVPGDPIVLRPGESLPPDRREGFALRRDAELASYKVEYSGSPLSSTELAFLGLVDGTLSELNLDVGIAIFGDILVPGLNNATTDLFIAVDLTQWGLHPTSFGPGDVFSISAGLSDDLPGFLIGTSPVTLGPNGFETANPFTGTVFVGALIDGESAVAGPGPVILLTSALLVMLRYGRRRRP
jgi:hypothetical protein